MTKECKICKKVFPLILKNWKKNKEGYWSSYCRKCIKLNDRIYSRKYRELNPDWKKLDNKRNKELINRLIKKYNKKYPERIKAQSKIQNAILRGKLKRQPCVICKKLKVDAHHPDYTKPLEVIWLCHKHHKQLHANIIHL